MDAIPDDTEDAAGHDQNEMDPPPPRPRTTRTYRRNTSRRSSPETGEATTTQRTVMFSPHVTLSTLPNPTSSSSSSSSSSLSSLSSTSTTSLNEYTFVPPSALLHDFETIDILDSNTFVNLRTRSSPTGSTLPTLSERFSQSPYTLPLPSLLASRPQYQSLLTAQDPERSLHDAWRNMVHIVDRLLLRDLETDILDAVAHESLQTYEAKSLERDENRYLQEPTVRQYDQQKDTLEKCFICYESWTPGDQVIELPCSHVFHPNCLTEAIFYQARCPICRHQVSTTTSAFQRFNMAHSKSD